MSQPQELVGFKFKEIAQILVKEKDIHEGHWGVFVRFGLTATNIAGQGPVEELFPAAILPLTELGIQRFPEPNAMTVDAAIVNPIKSL